MNAYQHIRVEPMVGALGAEIEGVDASQPLSDAVRDEVWRAFLDHHLVVLRNQSLDPGAQTRFARQFGDLDVYPFVEAMEGHPHVILIIKEPETRINFGGGWHTDTLYLPVPPKATMLYAVETPERGGDTLYSNNALAFEALSRGMQAMVAEMTGVFSAAMVHGSAGAYTLGADHPSSMAYGDRDGVAEREVEHPVILTHPETGRRAIYASVAHTHRIRGFTRNDSLPILTLLQDHATKAEFTTRLRWAPGTLAMWDNRCVFHYALNDYPGQRREMRRIILKGEAA